MTVRQLFLRDEASLTALAPIDAYNQANAVLRFNDVGTWSVSFPANSPAGLLVRPGVGLLMVRDGVTVVAGPAESVAARQASDGVYLTLSGVTDEVHLRDYLALPDPFTSPNATPFAAEFDEITDFAETVLYQFVDRNLGPLSGYRGVPGLTLGTTLARGLSIRGQGRMQPVLGLLQEVALAGGDLGFRIVDTGTGIRFEVYEPADLTGTVFLGVATGTLLAANYELRAPAANAVYAGGDGDGAARLFLEGGDPSSISLWSRRVESFVDATNATIPTDFFPAVGAELARGAAVEAVDADPYDTVGLQIGRDYWLGDLVTVTVGDTDIAQAVRALSIDWSKAGEKITPTVGTAGQRPVREPQRRTFAALAAQGGRITRLQAR